ncbi:hypothetical protein SAMN06296427_107118 [Moheibacter sediminis]|uniref:Uncharacterized protein n=2 Tax=Moheibacter sediminis TaxID=1434700 RepID=A0A1W2BUE9_9FLAO|nr:hypothetical protein SAMN06296427_107118 [Moheibacter sediminis]
MEPQMIIDRYFKQIENYTIQITEKMKDHAGVFKTYTFAIPVEQIKFKIDDKNQIEIILPEINLE